MPLNPTPVRQRIKTFLTPRVEDFIVAEKVDITRREIPEYATPHPDSEKYPNHLFCFAMAADDQGLIDTFLYAMARESQDDYNWEFTDADISGSKFPAVKRTYVTLRSEFDPDSLAMGAVMPDTPAGKFAGTYVLADRVQSNSAGDELNSLFVVDTHTYIQKSSIAEIGVDPLNGKALYSTVTLYYASEIVSGGLTAAQLLAAPTNAFWGLQSDGTQRSGKQLSAEWIMVEQAQVVGGTMTNGVLTVQAYTSNDRYSWPPVLPGTGFVLKDWARLDGGVDIYPTFRFNPEGYDGPCLTTVTRTWAATPFTIPKVNQMLPTRMYYSCPYFTANVPECLHGSVEFRCDTGTDDPVYAPNSGSQEVFPATNYTDWPSTITAFDDQEPFRGGYLRTTKVVAKPSGT